MLKNELNEVSQIKFTRPLSKKMDSTFGGSIEPIHNPVTIAEIAVEKGASALLMPVFCRRQLFDLSDDMATKIDIQFYSDTRDALLKAMVE
jgi:ATP-dependent Lon protease